MFGKRKPVEVIFLDGFNRFDIPVLGITLKWTDCYPASREVEETKLVHRTRKDGAITKVVGTDVIKTKEPKEVFIYETADPNLMRFLLRHPQKKTGRINPQEVIEKGWLSREEVDGLVDQTITPVFDEPRPNFDYLTRYECENFAVERSIPFDPKWHIEDFRSHLAAWWEGTSDGSADSQGIVPARGCPPGALTDEDGNEIPAGSADSLTERDRDSARQIGDTADLPGLESEDHNAS